MKQTSQMILLCGTLLSLAACRKDLCYDHIEHSYTVKTEVEAAWEQAWERDYGMQWETNWPADWQTGYDELRPDVAEGIRGIVYETDGTYSENNLPPAGGRLPMSAGSHPLLFYNNDTEYIVFSGLPSLATASATTRTRTRSSFDELHEGERTVNPPDMLYGSYVESHEARKTLKPVALPVVMRPLVYTYLIRFRFTRGLEYVALARGALAGMAETVYLQDGRTSETSATVLYDECSIEKFGVQALVRSFGVPGFPDEYYSPSRGSRRYSLSMEVRMTNGKYKTFEFDVTGQLEKQPRGGVIEVDGLSISSDEGSGGGGGFDADVDGWGNEEDIVLPIE